MKTDPKERLEELQEMLKGRLDMKGRPLTGYAHNVELVRGEIARLELQLQLDEANAKLEKLESGENG